LFVLLLALLWSLDLARSCAKRFTTLAAQLLACALATGCSHLEPGSPMGQSFRKSSPPSPFKGRLLVERTLKYQRSTMAAKTSRIKWLGSIRLTLQGLRSTWHLEVVAV